jgi:hypothetical protein
VNAMARSPLTRPRIERFLILTNVALSVEEGCSLFLPYHRRGHLQFGRFTPPQYFDLRLMASEQDIRALPNGSRFYRADLHIHSYGASHDLSDAKMTPQGIVQTAIEQNLHLIAITPFVERATRLPVSVLLITCKRPGSCIPTELRAWRRSCWDGRRGPGGVSQAGGLRRPNGSIG